MNIEIILSCSIFISQLCQRMCLLDIIAEKCQCIHPLYTDFDLFKNYLEATYEMQICNLIQKSKYTAYYLSWSYLLQKNLWSILTLLINKRVSHPGSDEKCISGILLEFDKGTRSCPCNVGCKETEYEKEISSSILPIPNNDVSAYNLLHSIYIWAIYMNNY